MPFSYLVTMYAIREHVDAFASYLNNISAIHVKRAAHDEVLRPGVVYLNSGLDYTTVHEQGDDYILHVSPAPFASRKGAIDMLMFSAADVVKEDCIGIILSGSGFDGAEGIEEIVRVGGTGLVQSKTSCLCESMVSAVLNKSIDVEQVSDMVLADKLNTLSI